VTWRTAINRALTRATGYQLRKAGAPAPPRRRPRAPEGERLVTAPAFVLCTLRSGSTLLRVLLDSHSQIHAPQELHLRHLSVAITSKWARTAMEEIGLDERGLEHLLWDRVLHRELSASGKRQLVNKTPNDVFIADRIRECWPDARFIFLLRHPGAIARSRQNLRPGAEFEETVATILRYGEALEAARQRHPGLTVRYEDLTADPAAVTRAVCAHLGLAWEPGMLDYGRHDHGRYRPGLGDWADKIRTGQVQAAEPPPAPAEVPPALRALGVAWGYLRPEDVAAGVGARGVDAGAGAGAAAAPGREA